MGTAFEELMLLRHPILRRFGGVLAKDSRSDSVAGPWPTRWARDLSSLLNLPRWCVDEGALDGQAAAPLMVAAAHKERRAKQDGHAPRVPSATISNGHEAAWLAIEPQDALRHVSVMSPAIVRAARKRQATRP
jgi:hypothetical protein